MKNLIANTIEKIKREKIQPEPRWRFLAKKYSVWTSFFVAALAGATAFSVALFIAMQLDWDLYPSVHRGPISYFFSLLPYVWIAPLAVLAILAFFNLRRTETGYRYNSSKIVLAVLGIFLAFGFAMAASGFGGKINCAITRGFPGYGKIVTTKESQWSQPEKGLLSGTVGAASENSFDIQDLKGKQWRVNYDDNTNIRPSVDLAPGEMIKAIGEKENDQVFSADEIRPWQGKGRMQNEGGRMNGRHK